VAEHLYRKKQRLKIPSNGWLFENLIFY
jgi:hypothetical protein